MNTRLGPPGRSPGSVAWPGAEEGGQDPEGKAERRSGRRGQGERGASTRQRTDPAMQSGRKKPSAEFQKVYNSVRHGLQANLILLRKPPDLILVFQVDVALQEIGHNKVIGHKQLRRKTVRFDLIGIDCE